MNEAKPATIRCAFYFLFFIFFPFSPRPFVHPQHSLLKRCGAVPVTGLYGTRKIGAPPCRFHRSRQQSQLLSEISIASPRPLPLTLPLSREKEKKKKNAFCLQCPNHKIKRISIRQLMSNCCKKMKKSKKKKRERSAKQARKWLFPPEPFVTAVITSPFNPPIPPAGGQLSCHNAVPPD